MGPIVSLGMTRTLMATVLTITLVIVPYGAWYITGSSKIRQDAQRVIEENQRQSATETSHLATQLGQMLEQLRQFESNRPFFHYQSLYHDPRGAHEGASIVPSVLGQGPADPVILTYFQVSADGAVTLPTLNERIPELTTAAPAARLVELRDAVSSMPLPRFDDAPAQTQRFAMPRSAWEQNKVATDLYLALRSGAKLRTPASDKDEQVSIAMEPMAWHTLALNGQAVLVALRRVLTPAGLIKQGFILSPRQMDDWLTGRRQLAVPVRLSPGRPTGAWVVAAPALGDAWWVTVDLNEQLTEALRQADESYSGFLTEFVASAVAALIAAVCVIGLVRQSEQLARQRSRFAASAAHELRTPLAGLQMYGDMLAEGLGDPDNARAYARRISDEAQRLGRVVSNVLGFARLERGMLTVRPEFGDLGQAVRDAITRQKTALDRAGVKLDVAIADDLPPVRFEADSVAQIMQNLLDNAEKYSRGADNRTIHITLKQAADGVALAVRDHGPGVDPSIRRKLFEPFTRGRREDAPAGIGLGLTITRALVGAHGGRIEVDNAPGGGAIFTVTFPG